MGNGSAGAFDGSCICYARAMTWTWFRSLCCVSALALSPACAKDSSDGDDGGDGSGDGGSGGGSGGGDDGGSGSDDGGGTGGTGGGTGGGTSVPGSCDDYLSDGDIGPEVTITVRHDGSTPVYFNPVGCGGAFPIAIKPEGGEPFGYRLGECFPVICETFFDLPDCQQGRNDCEGPPGGRIDPAASRDSLWSGVMLTELQMTAECAPGDMCQSRCLREDQAPAGTYELELTVYTTCTGPCDCEGEPTDGVCQIWQYDAELSDPTTVTATIDYPAQTSAELVLDI